MHVKKRKSQQVIFKIFRTKHIVIGLIAAIAVSVFVVALLLPTTAPQFFPPLAETDTTEMHTLPSDIRKVLGDKTQVVSYRVPILMYHYVEYVQDAKDTIRQSLDTIPATFEEQLQTLITAGYTFMTARELGNVLDGSQKLPSKPILLTFDDGYRDFYTDAYPLLKKYHVKATAYIVPGFLDKPNYMFSYQVSDLVNDGLVEIGAHTIHHVWLKDMPKAQAEIEIAQSKKMLEDTFNIRVVSFAYPYGAFDKQALDLTKQAGFWTAVSTIPGIDANQNDQFFLYRLRPGGRTGTDLLNWLDIVTYKTIWQ